MLIVAGTLAGCMESRKLAARVIDLEAFLRFLSRTQTEIRFEALPVEQIVRRHGGELNFLRICARGCTQGKSFSAAWEESVAKGAKDSGFLPSDIELLQGFGREFGATDVEGQLSHCALYTELVSEHLRKAREEKEKKSKLYRSLGIFGGVAAAIVLW